MGIDNCRDWFDSEKFAQAYTCDAPLGVLCGPQGTRFALWAPTAQAVTLRLYGDGCAWEPFERQALWKGEHGLWVYETERCLHGVYYDYDVTVDGVTRTTPDPWARACGINGWRSMAVDLSRTNPPGWAQDRAPARQAEDIIYELHVKDFSWDPSSGVPEAYRGRYKALTLADTSVGGGRRRPTCLAYLRRLGVTHVELMPVFDFGSVDEAGDPSDPRAFNWGYDPVGYNVPEGSYATDPWHG
ncbi:MAG: type I pullulanase, partial [Candidatus Ventricola sp.]